MKRCTLVLMLASLSFAITGCGVSRESSVSTPIAGVRLSGMAHGGNQPISSMNIQLYAFGSTVDGGAATPLLTKTITTDSHGLFNISSDYSCPTAGTLVYLAGNGGNPGLTGTVNNTAITLLASLGTCGGLSSSTFINLNEVTTVGSLAAIFPFASSYTAIGVGSSDATLGQTMAANVSSYVNTASGSAPGPSLATGYYGSSQEINALANSIALCINSSGGVANDGSDCGNLFALATPQGGTVPTDIVAAVLDILKNPTNNVSAIFGLASAQPPFSPAISSAPAQWVLPITANSNPTIVVTVSGSTTVNLGTPVQYNASVTGTTNQQVIWQANGIAGGNSTYGTISPSGYYTPPATVPTAYTLTISALSAVSTTASGSLTAVLYTALPSTQGQWMTYVSQQNTSPVTAAAGDSQISWTAPDGRSVNVVVKSPAPAANAPTLTMGSVPTGADARPYFDAALSLAASQNAGRLLIPTATYTFKTLGTGSYGQLQILGQSDLVIDGQGSTFIFTLNDDGIVIGTSQRVLLENCIIQYVLPTQAYWIGTMSSSAPYTLMPISGYTVTSSDTIGHMAQYNSTTNSYIHSGNAIYSPVSPVFTGSGFTSTSFTSAYAGKTFMVFEHYYGGVAINIETYNAAVQSQDISLNNVTINSGPGMAIVAYGITRGFGLWNSHILPATGSLISTEYDAINVGLLSGDVYIHDNVIGYEGDDAFNLHSLITPILSYSGTSLTMSTYSRFIQQYDWLSFFDTSNNLLGVAQVVNVPVNLGSANFRVTLSNAVAGVTTSTIVRDMNIPNSRVAFVSNAVENCQCHGSLIQTPNVLVQGNTYTDPLAGGISLLTNIGTFQEGTGAINVLVQNNTINTTGIDVDIPNTSFYAGIYAYGGVASGLTASPSNQYINILNNIISNTDQDCIIVASSQYVNVTSNQCNSDNLTTHGSPSIYILKSNNVNVSGNSRTGTYTGPLSVDSGTTSNITAQSY